MTDQTLTTGRSLSEFTAQLASAQPAPVSYTNLRAHETCEDLVFRLLL